MTSLATDDNTQDPICFLDNKCAEYKNGKSTVKLDAPHMSFDVDVVYGQNPFFKAMNEVNIRKEQQRKDQQASMLQSNLKSCDQGTGILHCTD